MANPVQVPPSSNRRDPLFPNKFTITGESLSAPNWGKHSESGMRQKKVCVQPVPIKAVTLLPFNSIILNIGF